MDIQRQYSRRNEAGLLWQGIVFFLGLTFIDGNAVVSVFIHSMGGSLALAGLVSAVRVVPSILGQFLLGIQAGRISNLPRYITVMMAIFYCLPLAIAVVLLSGSGNMAALVAFLVIYALLWAGDGAILIGWYDLFGRLVQPRRRGLILGWQQLFGGILAVCGSFAVGVVLGAEALPLRWRYAILFSLAALFLGGSAIAMAFVRDTPHRAVCQENPLKSVGVLLELFRKNLLFRRMTVVQALYGIATMALPILILFSKQTFSFTMEMTALLIPAQTAGSLAGGLIWGTVSHRLGNGRIIQFNQANIILVMLLAAAAALTGSAWLAFLLAFLSGITFAAWMGFPNYIIDIVAEADRPQYLVLSSLVNLPFTFMPLVAGKLADSYGFLPVFVVCIIAATASLLLATRLLESPDRMKKT